MAGNDVFLYSGEANPNDVKLRDPTVAAAQSGGATGTGELVASASQVSGHGNVFSAVSGGGGGYAHYMPRVVSQNVSGSGSLVAGAAQVEGLSSSVGAGKVSVVGSQIKGIGLSSSVVADSVAARAAKARVAGLQSEDEEFVLLLLAA